ncbi:MAG: hypothetical protein DRN20_02330 [Thermoplasmata archaeon]|nr:MAG: hypothetical protein DRN20_02330 [Thermoplasmata archaeon]
MYEYLPMILLLFLVSFICSNVGVGGGSLYVPIMMIFTGMNIVFLIPASLVMVLGVAIASSYNHYIRGLLDLKIGALVSIFAVIGTFFGVRFALSAGDLVVSLIFFSVVLFAASKIFYDTYFRKSNDKEQNMKNTKPIYPAIACFSVLGGFLSASIGIGGGTVFMPVLLYLGKMKVKRAAGTSFFAIIVTAIFGILNYMAKHAGGFVGTNTHLVVIAGVCAAVGSYFGSKWGISRLRAKHVRLILALFLILGGVKVLLKALTL